MTKTFNMSDWRRKHILTVENKETKEEVYNPSIHGDIDTYEDEHFKSDSQGYIDTVTFNVGAKGDWAKTVEVPFLTIENWADTEDLPLDEDNIKNTVRLYFLEHFKRYFSKEGLKSIQNQIDTNWSTPELEESSENKKLNINEVYSEILEILKQRTRKLSDDGTFTLHEKLKGFFNKLI